MSSPLQVIAGPAAGQRLEVASELVVGRDQPGLAGLGGDPKLSRRHARFWRDPHGRLIVEDLGSTNGTLVNGAPLSQPHLLSPGDRVSLGGSLLEFAGAAAPAPSAAPAAAAPVASATPAAGAPVASATPAASGAPAAPTSRGALPLVLGVLLAAVTAAFAMFLIFDGDDDGTAAAGTGERDFDGTLYTLSNGFAPKYRNSVLAYRTREGSLLPMDLREYPTGGTGARNINLNLAIDAEQEINHDPERDLLFAVNPGSDTVAVFSVASDGTLAHVEGSPFPSGGVAPISTGIAGDTLLVVNKGHDGVRRLREEETSVTQFRIGSGGRLTPIGTPIDLPNGTNPTQVLVTRGGRLAVVSLERGDQYVNLLRRDDGTFEQGEPTPITDRQRAIGGPGGPPGGGGPPPGAGDGPPPGEGGPPGEEGGPPAGGGGPPPGGGELGSIPEGALGLTEHPNAPVVYSELPNYSLLMVHEYDDAGRLRFVRGVRVPQGFLACWAKVSADGRFLYVANTGEHTIAVFDVSDPRDPRHLQSHPVPGPGGVASIYIDEQADVLYALDHFDPLDLQPGDSNRLHAFAIGGDGRLSGGEEGSLRLPVGADVSPIGMLWLPRDDD